MAARLRAFLKLLDTILWCVMFDGFQGAALNCSLPLWCRETSVSLVAICGSYSRLLVTYERTHCREESVPMTLSKTSPCNPGQLTRMSRIDFAILVNMPVEMLPFCSIDQFDCRFGHMFYPCMSVSLYSGYSIGAKLFISLLFSFHQSKPWWSFQVVLSPIRK